MTGYEQEVLEFHIQKEELAIQALVETKQEYKRIIDNYTFRIEEVEHEIKARQSILEKLRALR